MESEKIISIFDEVQRTTAAHRSSLPKLLRAVEASPDALPFILSSIMPHVIIVSKKEPSVERVIDFFCKFSASVPPSMLQQIIEFLLIASAAADKTIRVRSCQTIAGIFAALSEGEAGEISSDIADAVEVCLMKRLRDKIPLVKTWAVKALGILQDPQSSDDRIMAELIRLMSSDASKDVRVAAVEKVNVCKQSLPDLMERIKDVSPEVRAAAFIRLASIVEIRHLRVPMRASIVQYGLKDRDESVRLAAIQLILKWTSCLDNEVPKVLNLMGLQTYEEEAEVLARTIIAHVDKHKDTYSDLNQIFRESAASWQQMSFASVSPGELLWAQIRLEHYSAAAALENGIARVAIEDVVNQLRPDTVRLCELLTESCQEISLTPDKSISRELNIKYLLRIAAIGLDRSDVAGCTDLKVLCEIFMMDTITFSSAMLEPVFSAWAKSVLGLSGNSSTHKASAEIINAATVLLISKLWIDDPSKYGSGASDEEPLGKLRAIELAILALQMSLSLCGNLSDHPSGLVAVVLPYSLEALQTPWEALRMAAVRCFGLLGLSSEGTAPTVWEILLQVASQMNESDVTRCWAIQGIADIATARLSSDFSQDSRLSGLLTRSMERSDLSPIVSRVAAEATSKLLFSGSLKSSKMLSTLLRVYFFAEDASEEDETSRGHGAAQLGCHSRVQQILGVFFHAFNRAGNGREDILLESIPDFVADYAQMVCNSEVMVPLQQVLSFLISLGDDMTENAKISKDAYCRTVCSTAFASIFRECLKLGKSQSDRLVIKELMKAVQELTSSNWTDDVNMLYCVGSFAYILKKNYPVDKITNRTLAAVCKPYKLNQEEINPNSPSYQAFR